MDSRGSNETMSFFVDVVTEDSFYENLTLGVVKILENSPCVKNVRVNRRNGCERNAIANWEQRHGCMLPEDVKNFYASIDGFLLQWNLEIAGTSSLYIFFFLFPFLFFFFRLLHSLSFFPSFFPSHTRFPVVKYCPLLRPNTHISYTRRLL